MYLPHRPKGTDRCSIWRARLAPSKVTGSSARTCCSDWFWFLDPSDAAAGWSSVLVVYKTPPGAEPAAFICDAHKEVIVPRPAGGSREAHIFILTASHGAFFFFFFLCRALSATFLVFPPRPDIKNACCVGVSSLKPISVLVWLLAPRRPRGRSSSVCAAHQTGCY